MKTSLIMLLFVLAWNFAVWGQGAPREMSAFVGQTVIIDIPDADSVVIDRRDVLNYVDPLPPDENRIVLTGVKQGVARVTVEKGGTTTVFTVAVSDPNEDDRAKLLKDLVGAPGLDVRFVGGAVVLQGEVEDDVLARRAVSIAQTYSPSVLNFITVAKPLQVRIKVQVVSITLDQDSRIGVEYGPVNSSNTGLALPFGFSNAGGSGVGFPFFNTTGLASRNVSGVQVPSLSNFFVFGADVNAAVNLAQNVGKVRILQEPTLTVLNGQSSVFRVGGEFPVLTRSFSDDGRETVSPDYRPFGISLLVTPLLENFEGVADRFSRDIQPLQASGLRQFDNVPMTTASTIDRNGIIRMFVRPEISSLDFSRVDRNPISEPFPTLLTRVVETRVAMKHRESLVIGGLFDDQMRESMRSVPFISKIPVLGELFKNRSKDGEKTELAFILTPEVIGRDELMAGDRPQPRLSEMAEQLEYASGKTAPVANPVKISAETVRLRSAEFVPTEPVENQRGGQATSSGAGGARPQARAPAIQTTPTLNPGPARPDPWTVRNRQSDGRDFPAASAIPAGSETANP
ncbi:MAG: hypothetical protein SNJ84_00515 [Verrucomicrobiia bacterium]